MTPQEITAAVNAFLLLEPEVQQALSAIIHHFHKRTPQPATPAANKEAGAAWPARPVKSAPSASLPDPDPEVTPAGG